MKTVWRLAYCMWHRSDDLAKLLEDGWEPFRGDRER